MARVAISLFISTKGSGEVGGGVGLYASSIQYSKERRSRPAVFQPASSHLDGKMTADVISRVLSFRSDCLMMLRFVIYILPPNRLSGYTAVLQLAWAHRIDYSPRRWSWTSTRYSLATGRVSGHCG